MNERGRRRITRKRERREKDRKSGPIAATAQTTVTPLEFTTTRTYTRSRQSRPLAHNFSLSLLRASGKSAHSVASRCTRAVLYSRATGSAIVCLSSSSRWGDFSPRLFELSGYCLAFISRNLLLAYARAYYIRWVVARRCEADILHRSISRFLFVSLEVVARALLLLYSPLCRDNGFFFLPYF